MCYERQVEAFLCNAAFLPVSPTLTELIPNFISLINKVTYKSIITLQFLPLYRMSFDFLFTN